MDDLTTAAKLRALLDSNNLSRYVLSSPTLLSRTHTSLPLLPFSFHPLHLISLLVQQQPSFSSKAITSSYNHEISEKFQHILKSYLKLSAGINRTPILVMYASDGGVGESLARYARGKRGERGRKRG